MYMGTMDGGGRRKFDDGIFIELFMNPKFYHMNAEEKYSFPCFVIPD